jgi:hypothetical protein
MKELKPGPINDDFKAKKEKRPRSPQIQNSDSKDAVVVPPKKSMAQQLRELK